MSADNRVVAALDVGGTSAKAALVDGSGELVTEPRVFPIRSGEDSETILTGFEAVLRALWTEAGDRPIAGVGVGMCGPLDYAQGICLIKGLSKYEAIYGVNLKVEFRRRMGLAADFPIRFVNDAAAFALGVSLYGPGRGLHRVMALTLGTGCGSAFVVDGEVQTTGAPGGGEIYHLPYRGGMIDDWISRRGILRLRAEEFPGAPGEDVKDLADTARAGNPDARALFARFGEYLAEALGPVAEQFRPDAVIIGGRIAASLELFEAPFAHRVGVPVIASADQVAAIRGAAGLIWRG
jgi:glucokinase